MRTSRAQIKQIIATYARALFEAADAASAVDTLGGQLTDAASTIRGHMELRDSLAGEAIPAPPRASIAREVFASLHPALVGTLGVMAERGDISLLPSVVEEYGRVAEEARDTVTAEVVTVVELTDALREAITGKLAADLGKKVVLREKVDPSIIGGIIISTHGQRIDASMASQLAAARRTLSTAHTGGDA
jgi:F-type H+-transporting ATPase subunit delta